MAEQFIRLEKLNAICPDVTYLLSDLSETNPDFKAIQDEVNALALCVTNHRNIAMQEALDQLMCAQGEFSTFPLSGMVETHKRLLQLTLGSETQQEGLERYNVILSNTIAAEETDYFAKMDYETCRARHAQYLNGTDDFFLLIKDYIDADDYRSRYELCITSYENKSLFGVCRGYADMNLQELSALEEKVRSLGYTETTTNAYLARIHDAANEKERVSVLAEVSEIINALSYGEVKQALQEYEDGFFRLYVPNEFVTVQDMQQHLSARVNVLEQEILQKMCTDINEMSIVQLQNLLAQIQKKGFRAANTREYTNKLQDRIVALQNAQLNEICTGIENATFFQLNDIAKAVTALQYDFEIIRPFVTQINLEYRKRISSNLAERMAESTCKGYASSLPQFYWLTEGTTYPDFENAAIIPSLQRNCSFTEQQLPDTMLGGREIICAYNISSFLLKDNQRLIFTNKRLYSTECGFIPYGDIAVVAVIKNFLSCQLGIKLKNQRFISICVPKNEVDWIKEIVDYFCTQFA